MIIVVMGVSGAGKSTLGKALAVQLAWDFIEGDDYHPSANIEKMRSGHPLNDEDRKPWLMHLHRRLEKQVEKGVDAVLACSALKKDYREVLSDGLTALHFVYLCGETGLIRERLKAREQHFMLPELLDSQVAALEPPADAILVPVDFSTEEQVGLVRKALGL